MRVAPLKLKLQLTCGKGLAMDSGKADLLEAADRAGSIIAARRAPRMSYRPSWLLVDEMNRCFTEQLIEAVIAGGREWGARLTEAGRTLFSAYRALEAGAALVAGDLACRTLAALLLPESRPAKV